MKPTNERAFPVLATDRLILRELRPDDLEPYHAMMAMAEVTRFSNWRDAPDREFMGQYIQKRFDVFATGDGCSWAIEERASGAFAGSIRFNYFIKDWKCAEVGYELHPSRWGMGLMTEAVNAVAVCGHDLFGLNRIDAWTMNGNPASDRVLEKCGFQYEGTVRRKGWFKGAFHDLRIFGRLAADPCT